MQPVTVMCVGAIYGVTEGEFLTCTAVSWETAQGLIGREC